MAAERLCESCGASEVPLRRGRCHTCYQRWEASRPIGVGASCTACGDRRRVHLKLVEFGERWITLCHNCSAEAHQLEPHPNSIDALREGLSRDRRQQVRRVRRIDHTDYCDERRQHERRLSEDEPQDDHWLDAEGLIIGAFDQGTPTDEATQIVEV